jgi:hypothetical protein
MFSSKGFLKGLGKMIFFGMGTTPKVCFLGGMGRRSLVISQTRKVGFSLIFQGIIFLEVWNGGWLEKGGLVFFSFFSFVI